MLLYLKRRVIARECPLLFPRAFVDTDTSERQSSHRTVERPSSPSRLMFYSSAVFTLFKGKRSSPLKKYTKLYTSVITAGLLFGSSAVMAAGQIAVITNDTVIESGEEIGATVVLNGDGQYDVYVGITGGYFGGDIYAFTRDGGLVKWDAATGAAPAKFLDNASLSDMSVNERVIRLFPRIPLSEEYKGSYVFLAGLSSPGQLDFPIVDKLAVEVK